MAIYHLQTKMISRSKQQTAIGSAAYRNGAKLYNERLNRYSNYQTKPGVVYSEIFCPAIAANEAWCHDRQSLWTEVERSETRRDAQLARECIVGLPKELSFEQQKELLAKFVQENFVSRGMIADVNMHADNPANPHAHILLTTRSLENKDGKIVFGQKNRDWNKKEILLAMRENWMLLVNSFLEKIGCDQRIDHRSNAARGIAKKPTIHLGYKTNEALKKGKVLIRASINMQRMQPFNKKLTMFSPASHSQEEREKEELKHYKNDAKVVKKKFQNPINLRKK
jgi:ATP-dependent exoDNAse (exonuclease V) alpha subunit